MRWILILILSCTRLFAADDETVDPPKSFAREVMQPIFIPVVTAYHQIKENPFLNMARPRASGLEAMGDFFLAPSRYLFGGKKLILRDGKWETAPAFSYKRKEGIKASLSIIALPVAEVLGCVFKGAAFLSPETRRSYRAFRRAMADKTPMSKLQYYREQGIEAFTCDDKAPCLGFVRPSSLPKKHRREIKAFREVCQALQEHGIPFWLDCGSCLGAYRYGGMIPWDDDIDISILMDDHENVKKILSQLDPKRFMIQDWSSYKYPKTYLKLYLRETKTLIDIYHYNLDPQTRTATYFYTYKDTPMPEKWKKGEIAMTKPIPYDVIFPLQKAEFDGNTTWVPHQLENFLHYKYGENLTPTMIWDEKNQGYRKVKNHPYWKMVE